MNRKRWALLLLCVVLVFGYIKLFYKTYSTAVVAKSADCIVALDVKRITNTVIWNIITMPSQWKISNLFSRSKKEEVSWKDMVEIPDYLLAFHVNNQPANTWYLVLNVKDENDFTKGLQHYQFEKLSDNEYESKTLGLHFLKSGGKVLITNTLAEATNYLTAVGDELFTKKAFIEKDKLAKVTDAKSHLAIYIAANKFLQYDGVVTGNFDNQKIEINANFTPNKQYNFSENNFNFSSGSLCTMGFMQPCGTICNLLDDSDKKNISNILSINVDSVFRRDNKWYHLDIAGIKPRVDSAITYTYDDDFNKVEKVVVNNVAEPAFNFSINGDSINQIYAHLLHANKLEQTDAGQLFTAMPFVKSYCNKKSEKELNITAANYQLQPADKTINCVFFISILLTKIPNDLLKYLPDEVTKSISNIESIQLKANKQNEQLNINCVLQKKKNDLPVINL